jgi:hypothetical protein
MTSPLLLPLVVTTGIDRARDETRGQTLNSQRELSPHLVRGGIQ